MSKDLFAMVPEFLAAFYHVCACGFFEEVRFDVGGKMMEGRIYGCSINASGCVPHDKQYMTDGCGMVIDPHVVIASCRALAERMKVKNVMAKVETRDWPLYDADGDKIIGSKGTRTDLCLHVAFHV